MSNVRCQNQSINRIVLLPKTFCSKARQYGVNNEQPLKEGSLSKLVGTKQNAWCQDMHQVHTGDQDRALHFHQCCAR